MEGIQFVRENHHPIAEGCYLPRADLLGQVQTRLHELVFQQPNLKLYVPNLLDVDLFIFWDEDKFLLLISPEKRAQLPARGMKTNQLPSELTSGRNFSKISSFADVSVSEAAKLSFVQFGFAPGIAVIGAYPDTEYGKSFAAYLVANLILNWAWTRQNLMENSRIFLSHKGINKPLVEKIDKALRLLNLKTWFDRDDLNAGDTLVRSVDQAFAVCSAAVFFISKEYLDTGVIRKEIDRALHEAAIRNDALRIIPLVLRQHGGSDDNVPAPLKTLVWKTVDDVQIVPAILKALPIHVQASIAFAAPKS